MIARARERPPTRLPRLRTPLAVAAALFVTSFAVYGLTTGNLVGYEDETAAVAEGLVKAGSLQVLPGTPLTHQGQLGRGGHLYGRAGLTQPLLEAPFYLVGYELDRATSSGRSYRWRLDLLRYFDPFMAALTVVAIFALLLVRGRSVAVSLGVSALAAFASLIWPYAKIGMDTTLMAMTALALLAGCWAARGSPGRWAVAGVVAGAVAASKPYGAALALAMLPLLFEHIREVDRRSRLVAFAIPLLAWAAAICWYNWYRTGSVTNFDDKFVPALLSTPINALGLFISPGKGLLLYSPLVIVGLAGLRRLRRGDRALLSAIAVGVIANTLVIATSAQWSDETWGPRYIVPSAWLLLLPIAWLSLSGQRRRLLGALAALAVAVQAAGVFSPFGISIAFGTAYAGEPVYGYHVPKQGVAYGDDGPRWVPAASPLLFSTEVLGAWLKERVTGTGFVVGYHPLWGHQATFSLEHPERSLGVALPDFWWTFPGAGASGATQAAILLVLALSCGAALLATATSGSAELGAPARPAGRPAWLTNGQLALLGFLALVLALTAVELARKRQTVAAASGGPATLAPVIGSSPVPRSSRQAVLGTENGAMWEFSPERGRRLIAVEVLPDGTVRRFAVRVPALGPARSQYSATPVAWGRRDTSAILLLSDDGRRVLSAVLDLRGSFLARGPTGIRPRPPGADREIVLGRLPTGGPSLFVVDWQASGSVTVNGYRGARGAGPLVSHAHVAAGFTAPDWSLALSATPSGGPDLLWVSRARTRSRHTEVHVLTAASGYRRFGEQIATALADFQPTLMYAEGVTPAGRELLFALNPAARRVERVSLSGRDA